MSNNKLKLRFVNDFNLPIQVLDDNFFNYYLTLYESHHKSLTKWNKLTNMVNNNFNGNDDEWLAYYANVRDNIITSVLNNPAYIKFSQEDDMNKYIFKNDSFKDVNIYTENFINHRLLSIDLKKANFQALKFHNPDIVFNTNTYEDFIGKFSDCEYIKESKYTRQVIFGKLNPRRQITIERYIMNLIYNSNCDLINYLKTNAKLVSFKNDEMIFDVSDCNINDISKYTNITVINSFNVSIELFDLKLMQFKTHTGSIINVWRKVFNDGDEKVKSAPITYYPQIFKRCMGIPIDEKDLVFFHENQLAKFIYPLQYVK